MTNPAGSAVVNAIGPIRQIVRDRDKSQRRYLVIAPGKVGDLGAPVQVQVEITAMNRDEPNDQIAEEACDG